MFQQIHKMTQCIIGQISINSIHNHYHFLFVYRCFFDLPSLDIVFVEQKQQSHYIGVCRCICGVYMCMYMYVSMYMYTCIYIVYVHVYMCVYLYVYFDVDELTPAGQHTELTQLYYQQCMSRSQSWTYSTRSLISYYTDQLQYPDHQMQIQLLALLRRYLNKNIHNQSHQLSTN